jgi:riboflavin kinase/FMN adenylyltransferase
VHLPGFEGNLYDEVLDVAFLTRLRGEQKFDGVTELVAQIGRDVDETVAIFNKFTPQDSRLLR